MSLKYQFEHGHSKNGIHPQPMTLKLKVHEQ